MKRVQILLMIACCWLSLMANAQRAFAPLGAKWHYTVGSLDGIAEVTCVSVEIIKDTVILGNKSNVLEIKHIQKDTTTKNISHEYITQNGDSVFYYNPYLSEFVLLYNFGAQIGDTVTVHHSITKVPQGFFTDSVSSFKYIVTDIDSILFDAKWRKRQKIADVYVSKSNWRMDSHGVNSGFDDTLANSIVYGVGSTGYFFGWERTGSVATGAPMLRCYSDSVTNFVNSGWPYSCDYVRDYNGLANINKKLTKLRVFPNPVREQLFINNKEDSEVGYQITTLTGQLIQKGTAKTTIDVTTLKSQLYLLQIIENNVITQSIKFNKL